MTVKCAPWRRGWTTMAMVVAMVVAGPISMATAHDELTGTEPADGTTVEVAPKQVGMEFSGELASVGSFVTVTGPLGAVTDGNPQVDSSAVTQPLVDDMPPGEYAVVWRVTSQDGHPLSGEFGYTVASAGVEAQGDQAPATSTDDTARATTQAPEVSTSTNAPERAANTAAAPAQGDSSAGSGTRIWVWGVVILALVTLGGLGATVLRRR